MVWHICTPDTSCYRVCCALHSIGIPVLLMDSSTVFSTQGTKGSKESSITQILRIPKPTKVGVEMTRRCVFQRACCEYLFQKSAQIVFCNQRQIHSTADMTILEITVQPLAVVQWMFDLAFVSSSIKRCI